MKENPVGVFDSGVGGLSVLRAIRDRLPGEHLLYVADSRWAPYGEQAPGVIEARSLAIAEFLTSRGAKALVVACNTATSAAIAALRARFAIPVVGVEPALKPAASRSRSGTIGVLATRGTLQGEKFSALLARFGEGIEVAVQTCTGWVERVEAGDVSSEATRALVARDVQPLLERGIDTLVLGCTHYPFLAPLIREIAGPGVDVIETGPAIARELERRLASGSCLRPAGLGTERFWTSGAVDRVSAVVSQLWGSSVPVERLPEA